MPGLQISIGADVASAVRGLQDVGTEAKATARDLNAMVAPLERADRALGQTGKDAVSAASALKSIPPAAGPTGRSFDAVGASATKASDALKKVGPGANQAGNALTNVGRIAQDLPFGFIGIQNNLNPLLESFQRLKAETGSTKSAFAALGSSLIGPAGIGIALSVVSAAILIYQNGIAGFNKKTKEASDAAKDFVDKLRTVEQVAAESGAGVQGQIANVQALARVVTDANNSYTERSRALTELKQINKAYFGDLKLEENQMGALTAAVNQYTQALVAQAVLKGFTDEISKVSVELAKQQSVLDKNRLTFQRLRKELEGTKETEKSLTGEDRLTAKYGKLKPAVDAAEKAFNEQRDVVERLGTNFAELNGSIDGAIKKTLSFKELSKDTTGEKKQDDLLKSLKEELQGYQKQLEVTNKLREAGVLPTFRENDALALQLKIFETLNKIDAREVAIKLKPKLEIDPTLDNLQIQKAIEQEGVRSGLKVSIPVKFDVRPVGDGNLFSPADVIAPNGIGPDAFKGVIDQIKQQAINAQEKAKRTIQENFLDKIAGSLQEGIFNAADTLGQALGGIFSGDTVGSVLANAAEGLLGIIGGVVQEVGKQIAIIGGLMEVLKKALGNIFTAPAASIGIGLALVALGGLLKSIKIPGFADGVTGFPGGMALVGERGPELVRLPSGSDVIPNNRLGGLGGAIVLQPSVRFSGADFQVMLNKVEKSKRNLG